MPNASNQWPTPVAFSFFHFSSCNICCRFQRNNKFNGKTSTMLNRTSSRSSIFLSACIFCDAVVCSCLNCCCNSFNRGELKFSFSMVAIDWDKVSSSSTIFDRRLCRLPIFFSWGNAINVISNIVL